MTTAQPDRFAAPTLGGSATWRARLRARSAKQSVTARQAVPGWTIVSAGLSPVLLVGAWLVADARQPVAYSPIRQTMSVLAGYAATDRWIMTGAVFLAGGCHLITASGLTAVSPSARILLVIAGVSAIGIAASPEPVHGSTPQHLAWTALGAATIAIWPAFVARRTAPRPLVLSAYSSVAVTVIFVALLGWVLIQTRDGTALGLAERITTTVQTSWPLVVALAMKDSGTDSQTGAM